MVTTEFTGFYRWLSNFQVAPFVWRGHAWKSVEHAFQAAKCVDIRQVAEIHAAATAAEARRLGRRCTLRQNWEEEKDGIMLELVRCKFRQNPDLAAKLRATGEEELVENNWWSDTYWGVCRGAGQNKLGKILMQVRKELS